MLGLSNIYFLSRKDIVLPLITGSLDYGAGIVMWKGLRRQLAKEHKSICEALRTHDKESALRYVYVHIDNQQKAIIRSLNEEKEE